MFLCLEMWDGTCNITTVPPATCPCDYTDPVWRFQFCLPTYNASNHPCNCPKATAYCNFFFAHRFVQLGVPVTMPPSGTISLLIFLSSAECDSIVFRAWGDESEPRELFFLPVLAFAFPQGSTTNPSSHIFCPGSALHWGRTISLFNFPSTSVTGNYTFLFEKRKMPLPKPQNSACSLPSQISATHTCLQSGKSVTLPYSGMWKLKKGGRKRTKTMKKKKISTLFLFSTFFRFLFVLFFFHSKFFFFPYLCLNLPSYVLQFQWRNHVVP